MKRDDRELIILSKRGDMKAQLELWKKWEPFTAKQYNKAREVFIKAGSSLEDYMQDAYFAFLKALEGYDVEKAKELGLTSFSAYYYWFLKKMQSVTELSLSKMTVISQTDLSREDSDEYAEDAEASLWNKATSYDVTEDYKKEQAKEVVETYLEQEKNPVYKEIFLLLLEGKKINTIVHLLNEEYSYPRVKNMSKDIFNKVRVIADKVMFEPI